MPTTFACKVTMAVTGWIFAAFVAVHMVGNLKAYAGADSYNSYSLWLRHAFEPVLPAEGLLWVLRLVLLVSLLLHLGAALVLWVRSRRARGPHPARRAGTFASRTMLATGVALLAFVVFHILDLTLGVAGAADYRAATETTSYAYQNTVASFARPLSGTAYLAAMLMLGLHLAHGLWSTATDLGVTGRRTRAAWKAGALVVALVVALGNASLPIAVWTGVLA